MSEEDDTCPLCIEEIDITDRYFKPCPCGYRVCRFCWTNLIEQYDLQCPACRRPYSIDDTKYQPVPPEELEKYRAEKRKRIREKKEQQAAKESNIKQNKPPHNPRVVQKNTLYITGLPPIITNIDILKSKDILGQFGKIVRVKHSSKGNPYNPLFVELPNTGLYVFFLKKEDAAKAIEQLDGCRWGQNVVRVTYATTKCCTSYLNKQQCRTPNCMYLHRQGSDVDITYKEELSKSQLREKSNKSISSIFSVIDDNGFLIQKLHPGTGYSIPHAIASSPVEGVSETALTSYNKKSLPQADIGVTKKPTRSDTAVETSEKQKAFNTFATSIKLTQSPNTLQKQQKLVRVVKEPTKQRVHNAVTPVKTDDQTNKSNSFPSKMKTATIPKPSSRSKFSLEDSTTCVSPVITSPPISSSSPSSIVHPAQSASSHLKPVKRYVKKEVDNITESNWFPFFQNEIKNLSCESGNSTCSTSIPASVHKHTPQETPSGYDAFQSTASEDFEVFDKKQPLPNVNISAPDTSDMQNMSSMQQLAGSIVDLVDNSADVDLPKPAAESPTEFKERENMFSQPVVSIDARNGTNVKSGYQNATYFEQASNTTNIPLANNNLNKSPTNASLEGTSSTQVLNPRFGKQTIDASVLDALGYKSHPIYTGILDPLYDDTLSMLSSTVMVQGMTDEINDNAVYMPQNAADPQQKFRYFNNSAKKDPLVSSGAVNRQQPHTVLDAMQQRASMQIPVSQCNKGTQQGVNPAVLNNSGLLNGNGTPLNSGRISGNSIAMNNVSVPNGTNVGFVGGINDNVNLLNNANPEFANNANFFNGMHVVPNNNSPAATPINRYPQIFNSNIQHQPVTPHHDYNIQAMSSGGGATSLLQKHHDEYKTVMQNFHCQAPHIHHVNSVPVDYQQQDPQHMVRIDYEKSQQQPQQQLSSEYQDMYFVYPWSQQQHPKQNSHHNPQPTTEAPNHNNRRPHAPKKTLADTPYRKHLNHVGR